MELPRLPIVASDHTSIYRSIEPSTQLREVKSKERLTDGTTKERNRSSCTNPRVKIFATYTDFWPCGIPTWFLTSGLLPTRYTKITLNIFLELAVMDIDDSFMKCGCGCIELGKKTCVIDWKLHFQPLALYGFQRPRNTIARKHIPER